MIYPFKITAVLLKYVDMWNVILRCSKWHVYSMGVIGSKLSNDLFITDALIKSVHEPHLLVILNSTRRKKTCLVTETGENLVCCIFLFHI